jgi:diguanylate cyclase (GGDEF)-like protein
MNSRLLGEVALAFADREEFGTQLSTALKALCSGLQLSRAYVYLDGPNRATIGYVHEWCAEGIDHQWMQNIPYSSYGLWKRVLTDDGKIVAADTMTLPGDLRALLEPGGIQSLQVYPIKFGEEIVGFAGFDDCRRQRFWLDEETNLLKAASTIISALCEREILREHVWIESHASDEGGEVVSIRDPLTGTYNKRYVFDRLVGFDAEYARLGRNFCISLLDIDQFKAINDQYGHDVGDFILKEFASVINLSIRPYDLSGRLRDDVFIIASVNASAMETGYLIERIRGATRNHVFSYGGTVIRPNFSYGIADSSEFSPENLSIEKMVELADQRRRASKETELVAPSSVD